uniref:Carboxylic ester hydrolase n=1 Tax=Arcella intermedia TaxID=1963864 RepID=A0A6B2L1V8_9EUKA
MGVPFVAPPVGSLRWANPVPPTPWSDVLPTRKFKAGCPQKCVLPANTCPDEISEDCLYLNVYAPRLANVSTPQPVMVFIPGGHFDAGTAGCILYDGSTIVSSSNVVLVTINYRLGFLGWLTNVSPGNFSIEGNFGFMDQIFALRWVRDNIAAFGGDPNQVTLYGQSAGSSSTRAHLMSPLSAGLFHKAILQSDPLSLPFRDTADATTLGVTFTDELKCSDINCLRSKTVEEILLAQDAVDNQINLDRPIIMFLPIAPTVDGSVIPHHTFDAFQKGEINKVPMIFGATSEDALLFIYKAANFSLTDVEYYAILAFLYGIDAFSISKEYPAYPDVGDKRPAVGFLGTHYIFDCPARYVESLFHNLTSSLYLYQWDHAISPALWGPDYWFCYGHVCHGSELPFEFAGTEVQKLANWSDEERQLSRSIIGYYTNFARTGNPNSGHYIPSLNWPKWDPQTLQSMHFQTPQNTIDSGLLKNYCDFWDKLGYKYGW